MLARFKASPLLGLRRAGPLLAIGVLGIALLAGCGGSSHKSGSKSGSSSSGSKTTGKGGATVRPVATLSDTAGLRVGQQDSLRLTVYGLRRTGPFVTLDFGVVCSGQDDECNTGDDFDGETDTAQQIKTLSNTAGGINLVDSAANKEYQPVLDSQGRPYSSSVDQLLTDRNIHLEWVTFPAPPASVTSLDVLFPNGGPVVPAVPITSGSQPSPSQVGPTAQAATPAPFDKPPGSLDPTGLTLPIKDLVLTVGNKTGAEAASGSKDTLTLRADVLFQFDKSNLTPAAQTIIRDVAARIKTRARGQVQVTGYTDSIGTDAVNIPLSQARARSVVRALRPLTGGIVYSASGKGSADPVAPNIKPDGSDNPAGRALNRRVTITFRVKAPVKPAAPAPQPAAPPPAAGSSHTATYQAVVPNVGTSTYAVTANRLYRSGDLVVLQLSLACQSNTSSNDACNTEFDWSGTPTVPPIPANDASQGQFFGTHLDTLSAVYLSDSSGAQYVPVTDSDGTPLTTTLNAGSDVGSTRSVWLYFPGLPSSTSTASVVMPGGTPRIANVAISASP